MNSPKAAQARTAAPQAALPHSHPAPWFPPSFGFCVPWFWVRCSSTNSVPGKRLSWPPHRQMLPFLQKCIKLLKTEGYSNILLLSDVKSCVIEGREISLSQSIPEEPRISSSHRRGQWKAPPLPSRCCLRNTGSIQGKAQGSSCSLCLPNHTPRGCSRDHWTWGRAAFDLKSVLRDKINHFVTMSPSSGDAQDQPQAPPASDHKQGLTRSCTSSGHVWMSPLFWYTYFKSTSLFFSLPGVLCTQQNRFGSCWQEKLQSICNL